MSTVPSTIAQTIATAAGANMANLPSPNTIWQTGIAGGNLVPAALVDAFRTGLSVITVGSGGSAPNFIGLWVAAGGGTVAPSFYRDASGRVYLQGCTKSGTVGTAIFQLPAGYRPGGTVAFLTVSNNSGSLVTAQVNVDTSGNVTPVVGNNQQIFLDGISFFGVN